MMARAFASDSRPILVRQSSVNLDMPRCLNASTEEPSLHTEALWDGEVFHCVCSREPVHDLFFV